MLFKDGEQTPRTTLIVPAPAHYEFLYRLALEAGNSWPWSGDVRSVATFESSLYNGVFDHCLIAARSDGEPIGYLAVDNVNIHHGFAHIRCYLDSKFQKRGYPLEGVALMVDRLFEWAQMRNVYIDTTATTYELLGGSSGLFSEVARFEGKLVVEGKIVDQIIGGLSKATWMHHVERFTALLQAGHDAAEGAPDS